jgi:hypothetical protein
MPLMSNVRRHAIEMKRALPSIAFVLWCSTAFAGPTTAPVRSEIHALLSKLEISGCRFNRNGSWFSGSEAKDHLLRKLEYIEGRSTVQSTEQFIELAASKSSSSGKPYQVQCGAEVAVDSRRWLAGQLALLRGSATKVKP